MSPEFWAVIGVALAAGLAAVEKGQGRIEGWIAGRFREEAAP